MKKKAVMIGMIALLLSACTKPAPEGSETGETGEIGQLDSGGYAQLEMPEIGEEIIVIETDKGMMKARLFPVDAPKASENFLGLAGKSYYDDTVFHRIIENFMVQGGSPDGTGYGGESFSGEPFGVEISENLHHIRGALCMARSESPDSQTSQFYIVQTKDMTEQIDFIENMIENIDAPITTEYPDVTYGDRFPLAFLEHYKTYGGYIGLDYGYTVFGQVFEGFDVLDALAKVKTTEDEAYLQWYEEQVKLYKDELKAAGEPIPENDEELPIQPPEKSVPVEAVKVIKIYTEIYK